MEFLFKLEVFMNAGVALLAAFMAVIFVFVGIKQWKQDNPIAGAIMLASSALCILVGMSGVVTCFSVIQDYMYPTCKACGHAMEQGETICEICGTLTFFK